MSLIDKHNGTNEHTFDSLDAADEEPIQLLLTAVGSGINLASVEFQPGLKSDEFLLSGFLTVVRCISDAIFWASFDRMRFGRYTMLMKMEPPFLFSYIFSGCAKRAMRRLDEFAKILREDAQVMNSLMNTISTGAVDMTAKSLVGKMASEVFAYSEELLQEPE